VLAAHETEPFKGFGVFGVIKETGVDDEGLLEFVLQFPDKLYRDTTLAFYEAMGGRKLSIMSMLYKFVVKRAEMKELGKRMKEKNLKGNLKGEGKKQGGLVIFDKNGDPKYAFLEVTGNDLPVSDIIAAVNSVRSAQEVEGAAMSK
jgi:hypothetical protein